MMRHRWIELASALVIVLLPGCPPRPSLILYNNAGSTVSIRAGNDRVEWAAGSTITVDSAGDLKWASLTWEEDGMPRARFPLLVVRAGDHELVYPLRLPAATEDLNWERGGRVVRVLQLNPDWKLYAVRRGSTLPSADVEEQPLGMPLEARLTPLP
jgi:hypothetical protein